MFVNIYCSIYCSIAYISEMIIKPSLINASSGVCRCGCFFSPAVLKKKKNPTNKAPSDNVKRLTDT